MSERQSERKTETDTHRDREGQKQRQKAIETKSENTHNSKPVKRHRQKPSRDGVD